MERRLKERLVGASILVALIVLIVPELLSGPKPNALPSLVAPESVRHVTVDLATSKAPQATDDYLPATPSPAPSPAPVPVIPPATVASTVSAEPVVAAVSAPPLQTSVEGDWAVQLGSFASPANSDKLVHQLKAQGFPVYALSSGSGRTLRIRVRIGPLSDRSAAERTVTKLKSLGHDSSVVTPGR